MNSFMVIHQNDDENRIDEFMSLFNSTIDIIKQILGADAFFAVERETNEYIKKFSGSVYDSVIIPFSFFEAHELMAHANKIRTAIHSLKCDNEQYREDTYAATGSKKRVIGRIMTVYNLLANITGSYTGGEERTFQIV